MRHNKQTSGERIVKDIKRKTVRRHMKWHRLWARLRETLLIGLVDV